ncbi:hypothetical protein PG994_003108 [Apiospora phragmitis]|uniref:Uncharacterized protein n=1 Tax=Apiospora phragmitis TaxID=2905665 RepID=A0ABR1W742_9PEZI
MGGGCVRCRRLNRPCVPGEFSRKTAAQKKHDPVGRLAQLESKLDDLICALSSERATPLDAPSSTASDLANRNASSTPQQQRAGATVGFTPSAVPSDITPVTPPPQAQATDLSGSDFPPDVEECLHTFCHQMLRYFPFMCPPTDLGWVRRERPFLLLCICATSSKSIPTRAALGSRIKRIVADRLILDSYGTVNLDLLLGLLTFLAWGHGSLLKGGLSSFSRFAQLAMLVVLELRLNRQPTEETNMLSISRNNNSSMRSSELFSNILRPRDHTLEERRAVLGCFYISAVMSSYFGQIDALQWTAYMEEGLTVLHRSKECVTDESFVHQIRLQLLSREVGNVLRQTAPPHFYLKAFQSKLDGAKSTISQSLQSDGASIPCNNPTFGHR